MACLAPCSLIADHEDETSHSSLWLELWRLLCMSFAPIWVCDLAYLARLVSPDNWRKFSNCSDWLRVTGAGTYCIWGVCHDRFQLKKAPVLFCTAVKHLTVPHESWVPRSADTTLLNHSTVRGYLYWPTDPYTQETGPRSSKSGCRGLTHSDGYDFSAKHCTLFNFVPLSLCLF